MFKNNKRNIFSKKGFTFVEVMIVLVIVSVLSVAWFFTGKGHMRIAMSTEARVLIDKIISQERVYKFRHTQFFVTPGDDAVEYSPELQVDARQNKYYKSFKIKGLKVTGSGKILDGIKVTVYGREDDMDLKGTYIVGNFSSDGTVEYDEEHL